MRKNIISKSISPLIAAVLVFLASCGQVTPSIPVANPPKSIKTSAVETLAMSETIFKTPLPDTPTPTPIPTMTAPPTPSLTPLPTLDPEVAQLEVARLMETNDECSGACFWGITPEVTRFDQAVRFLETFKDTAWEQIIESKRYYYPTFIFDHGRLSVGLAISDLDGLVKSVSAGLGGLHAPYATGKDWLAFRPDNFFRTNGVPEQVNILMSEGPEGRVSYGMILFYDQMYIRYTGNQTIFKPQHILHACPLVDQNIQRFDLWLGEYDEEIKNEGVDLTWLTTLTSNDLFEILTGDPQEACFDLDYYRINPPN